MNTAIEIKKGIYWIGVNDRRTHIFENYWPLPKGVAYNSSPESLVKYRSLLRD